MQQTPQLPAPPATPTATPTPANSTLGGLANMPTALGTSLTAWAGSVALPGGAKGAAAGYAGALVLAWQANGQAPVTLAQVAGMYHAAGGIAPGRGNANGYANRAGLTVWRSLYYGANRHIASGTAALARHLANGQPSNGMATYSPRGTLLAAATPTPASTLLPLANSASAPQAGQTPRKGGTPTYGVQQAPAASTQGQALAPASKGQGAGSK